MVIIGLTGMSGAGKSTVSSKLKTEGFEIIDCDKIARDVVKNGTPCLEKIVRVFGCDMLTDDNELDRRKMAQLVFSDAEKRQLLNNTMYPFITYDVITEINNSKSNFVVIDAPTLFESGIDVICDEILSVVCDNDISINRIMKRDGIDRELAVKRLSSQHDKAFYINKSTFCIENNGSPDELSDSAFKTARNIRRKYE